MLLFPHPRNMEILDGLRHGDLSINHPQHYGRMLTEWIGR